MLQFIRSKAGSFVVRLLFVLLIGSFGIWGVGDFLRQTPRDNTLISVGSENFPAARVDSEFRKNLERLRQMANGQLDVDQARALGLVDRTVDQLVSEALFDQEAKRLHVVIGDPQIAAAIAAIPGLAGPDGKIDKFKFAMGLQQARLSEGQFVAQTREDLRRQTVGSVADETPAAPKALLDTLYGIRNEHRIADYVFLPASAVKDLPAPDDAALKDYYDKHPEAYTAPEYRGFTGLFLQNADVAASVKIDEAKLKETYDQQVELEKDEHAGDFFQPETRHVLQIVLPDEATAEQAEQALAAGKDFTEVAKTIGKQDATTVDLGNQTRKDLPPDIGEAAFAAKQDEVTKPVHSALGWHVIKVTAIQPETLKTFEQVKPQLEAKQRADLEYDALTVLSDNVRNALAGGADLASIATQFALKPVTVAATDETAKDPAGNIISTLPMPAPPVLKTVFDTAQGQNSGLEELPDNKGFYVVQVDSVTAPALRPLDTVKDKVKNAWLADQRTAKVAAQAKELADAVTGDMTLAKLAGTRKLELKTSKPFTRTNERREVPLPSEVISTLFKGDIGTVAIGAAPDGQYVAQLKEIQPAAPSGDASGTTQLKKQLDQELGNEMLEEFQLALRDRYPVDIHHAEIDQLLGGSPAQ